MSDNVCLNCSTDLHGWHSDFCKGCYELFTTHRVPGDTPATWVARWRPGFPLTSEQKEAILDAGKNLSYPVGKIENTGKIDVECDCGGRAGHVPNGFYCLKE